MNIAVIGWGSLIWDPKLLSIQTKWFKDGPQLPIEFARISSGDRLTLVIYPDSTPQTTYWALSSYSDLDKATENLREREKTTSENVHWYNGRTKRIHPSVFAGIKISAKEWLEAKSKLDAVIWTGLESNWKEQRRTRYSTDAALTYLREIEVVAKAEEYVRKAPSQIRTRARERIESELGWTPIDLSPELFQD